MQSQQVNDRVPEATDFQSVALRDYVHAVRRRWATMVVCAVLGIGGAAAYAKVSASSYMGTANVVLPQAGQLSGSTLTPTMINADMLAEQTVASSRPVAIIAAPAILGLKTLKTVSKAQLDRYLASVSKNLTVTVPTGADSLQISWRAKTASAARRGANAFAGAYLSFKTGQLNAIRGPLQYQLNGPSNKSSLVNQIVRTELALRGRTSPALVPKLSTQLTLLKREAAADTTKLYALPTTIGTFLPAWNVHRSGLGKTSLIGLGLLCGLILGALIAITRDLRDHTVRSPEQLEQELGAPVIGFLPAPASRGSAPGQRRPNRARGGHGSSGILLVSQPDAPGAQAVRALRATLVAAGVGTTHKVVLVTNADPADTSSRFAVELGLAMAESGRSTLLVGADVNDSTMAQFFGLPASPGLSNILANRARVEDVVRSVERCGGSALPAFQATRVHVLPPGPPLVRPLSLLDSEAMLDFLAEARAGYDVVLIDSPAKEMPDSLVPLARVVDGVLVVAGQERTRLDLLRAIRQRIGQVGSHVIGSVLLISPRHGRTGVSSVSRSVSSSGRDHFEDVGATRLQTVQGSAPTGTAAAEKGLQRRAGT